MRDLLVVFLPLTRADLENPAPVPIVVSSGLLLLTWHVGSIRRPLRLASDRPR
jgi:hypothetical protein